MPFPSTYSSFNRPTATDRLNSPSHSALHNAVSSAVGQIEQTIGLSASSLVGTLYYDIRSPDSDGGGHVQTANKGGTGQTAYTKGDLLVATSSSVITKLAVGTDGQALIADSSVASGVKWSSPGGSKIFATASVVTYGFNNSFSNASIVSTTIPGSTLGTNNAVRLTSKVNNFFTAGGGSGSILLAATYGGAVISSVLLKSTTNTPAGSIFGDIDVLLVGNGSTTNQRGTLRFMATQQFENYGQATSIVGFRLYNSNTSSVNSSANQSFGINAYGGSTDQISMTIDCSVVEKIF